MSGADTTRSALQAVGEGAVAALAAGLSLQLFGRSLAYVLVVAGVVGVSTAVVGYWLRRNEVP